MSVAPEAVTVKGRRQQVILAMLALNANRVVSIDQLAEAIWGEHRPATAASQVVICISALRRAFALAGAPEDMLSTASPGYVLWADPAEVDALLLESLAAQAEAAQAAGDLPAAAVLLSRACGLWRGPVLPGLESEVVEEQARWLEDRWFTLYENHVQLELMLGRYREVIDKLVMTVRDKPAREQLRAYLMVAQYQCGRRAEALDTYRAGLGYLKRELGIEPSVELQNLHTAILRDDTDSITAGYTSRPVVVLPDEDAIPAQLPGRHPHFIGRDGELAQLDALLDERSRQGLVSIAMVTGAGGVGKSSLAVHWAHRVAHRFPHGQIFVDLHGYDLNTEPLPVEVVMKRLLRTFGVPDSLIPENLDERAALFRTVIGRRRVLLVLDNARSDEQVRPLLPGSGGSCVVVASRRPLHGLAVQDGASEVHLDVLGTGPSAALIAAMTERTWSSDETEAIHALARLCKGLPLALRIVGAKLNSGRFYDVRQLVERLADEHRRLDELSYGKLTVRASLALSYRDLSAPAAAMFRLLGLVDTSTFSASVGAALLDVAESRAEALIDQLVDVQLVQRVVGVVGGRARHRLHDLVRLYARELAYTTDSEQTRSAAMERERRRSSGRASVWERGVDIPRQARIRS